MSALRASLVFVLVGLGGLGLFACGTEVERVPGEQSLIDLRVFTPPFQDAFFSVASLEFSLSYPDGQVLQVGVDQSASEFVLAGSPGEGVVLRMEGLGIDGTVLASGQSAPFDLGGPQATQVDILFARTGEFARLLGRLNHPRFGHTASVTADGRILILGGASDGDPDAPGTLAPPELYDPRTQVSCGFGDFECPAAPGADQRYGHTATSTAGGDVIVFGGRGPDGQLVDAVLRYQAASGDFRELTGINPDKVKPRAHHAAVAFAGQSDEEVIAIVGGELDVDGQPEVTDGCLLFDTGTEAFFNVILSLQHGRKLHTATAFGPDHHMLLVAGGRDDAGLVRPVEVFDGQAFLQPTPVGAGAQADLATGRVHHVAVEVEGGVLVATGDDGLVSLDAPELFAYQSELGTGVFPLTIAAPHAGHSTRTGALAASLPSGGLLLAGGEVRDGFERTLLSSAEVLLPQAGSTSASTFAATPLGLGLAFASATRLPGGGILFTGGVKSGPDGAQAADEVWYYNPR